MLNETGDCGCAWLTKKQKITEKYNNVKIIWDTDIRNVKDPAGKVRPGWEVALVNFTSEKLEIWSGSELEFPWLALGFKIGGN